MIFVLMQVDTRYGYQGLHLLWQDCIQYLPARAESGSLSTGSLNGARFVPETENECCGRLENDWHAVAAL
jgi:hypothetical protein